MRSIKSRRIVPLEVVGKGKLQEEHDCIRTEWKLLDIHCIITCHNIQISYTFFLHASDTNKNHFLL